MIYTVSGWRYWYRRYFGWIPIQFCMVCGKPYWGGFPRFHLSNLWVHFAEMDFKITQTWQASWKDYCSQKCADTDSEAIDNQSRLG